MATSSRPIVALTIECIVALLDHLHAHVSRHVGFETEAVHERIFRLVELAERGTEFVFFAAALITLNSIH